MFGLGKIYWVDWLNVHSKYNSSVDQDWQPQRPKTKAYCEVAAWQGILSKATCLFKIQSSKIHWRCLLLVLNDIGCKFDFFWLVEDIHFNSRLFTKLHYSHTQREDNMITHKLVRYALHVSDIDI